MTDLKGRTVGVIGLGASGVAAARLCLSRGARVHGFDEAPAEKRSAEASALDATLHHGPLDVAALKDCDLLVASPGMPPRAAIDQAERAGSEVIGELELASRFLDAPIALVGGTNGKSTVTALSGAILHASGKRVFVGGNFGRPLCEAVSCGYDALVVEVSSFQAERVPTLRPKVHALLNVTEDHLDRYDDFAAYARAKGNPFANMQASDVAVIPAGDAICAEQAARGQARVVTFGLEDGDVRLDGEDLVDTQRGIAIARSHLQLSGNHNAANACAAMAIAGAFDVPAPAIAAGMAATRGLPHRAALVADHAGVRWYDDSKATNVGAAIAALRGLAEARAVLIAGGRDKQGSYAPLAALLAERGRALVVLGEAAELIAGAAAGVLPIARASSMDDAVAKAASLARAGDAVLLSPACSSYDMYKSFGARGDDFARAVTQYLARRGSA